MQGNGGNVVDESQMAEVEEEKYKSEKRRKYLKWNQSVYTRIKQDHQDTFETFTSLLIRFFSKQTLNHQPVFDAQPDRDQEIENGP